MLVGNILIVCDISLCSAQQQGLLCEMDSDEENVSPLELMSQRSYTGIVA